MRHPRSTTFFGFGSVPLDIDDARAFIQRRLALFLGLTSVLAGVFFLSNVATHLVLSPDHLVELMTEPGSIAHVAMVMFNIALWLVCRRGARPELVLHKIDALGTSMLCAGYCLLAWGSPVSFRPEYTILFASHAILMGRAALVPSTGRRTFWIALWSTAPNVVATYLVYEYSPPEHRLISPAFMVFNAAKWDALIVALSAVVSSAIYGLHKRVQEALQLGQYTLEERIGEGGMGVVYKARHAMLRRPTAIKLLPADRTGELSLARFEREVQLTSKLTHPNTISIYDFGRTPDGVFYYAMEYLEGLDLETLVEEYGAQPPERVVHILTQACGALNEAHLAGLIHRDIKPANIFLCERGAVPDFVKVLDFGLVKHISGAPASVKLSREDALTGTPLYLAPEAIRSPDSVDGRTDIYALGAVGYFLITGRALFDGKTLVEVCSDHLHTKPVPPAERLGRPVPASLSAVLLRCLEKDPAARPSDVRALAAELRACAEVPAWDEEEARAWWAERARRAPARRPEQGRPHTLALQETIAVDLAARQGARLGEVA